MIFTQQDFINETHVSRETLADFQAWHALLVKWNARINLVSRDTIDQFWFRHALDSWQICEFIPKTARSYLDLGSGGGFPGIALAISCKQRDLGQVTLVESVGKKGNFLRTLIRELELPATVLIKRIETLPTQPFDIISARAFAPLPKLLTYTAPFWKDETIALLHKGENSKEELTRAQNMWNFDVESFPSRSDPTGVILKVTNLALKP